MNTKLINKLRKEFEGVNTVTKDDIYTFSQRHGLSLSDGAVRKRIHTLKSKGIIIDVKRGVYSFNVKAKYNPRPDYFINKARRLFTDQYPEIDYCIWSSAWLHEFMLHQPFSYFYIFETEKDMLQTAFELFKDNNIKTYLEPDKEMMLDYVGENKNALIIKLLNARSPKIKIQNNKVPALEKILTDAFCDKEIFYFYQGEEMRTIFETAISKYNINFSSLLRYADVRERKTDIKDYLLKHEIVHNKILK